MNNPTQEDKVAVLKRIARAASLSGDSGLLSTTMLELSEYGVTSWEDLPSSEVISKCVANVEGYLQRKVKAARSNHMRDEFREIKRNVMHALKALTDLQVPSTTKI